MKLSLRVRVLAIVTTVNLVVFGASFWIATREIQSQLRVEYERNLAEASRVLFERLQSSTGNCGATSTTRSSSAGTSASTDAAGSSRAVPG